MIMFKTNSKKLMTGVLGLVFAVRLLAPAIVEAYTISECESPGVGGTCRMWCDKGETEVGTCADADVQVTCCSKKTIPMGGSLTPGPSASNDTPAAAGTTAGTTAGSPMTLTNPLCPPANPNCVTLNALIGRFVAAFIGMVGALALLVFVYAGIMYMTAGSSDRVKQARDTMKYAVIGLALIIFAYALTNFFFNALSSSPPSATPPKKATTLPKS